LLAWPSSTSAQETIRDSVNLAITYDPSLDRIKGKGKKNKDKNKRRRRRRRRREEGRKERKEEGSIHERA